MLGEHLTRIPTLSAPRVLEIDCLHVVDDRLEHDAVVSVLSGGTRCTTRECGAKSNRTTGKLASTRLSASQGTKPSLKLVRPNRASRTPFFP